ncbi:unnamed protein product, partial [Heterosigma akashiwo]
ARVPGDGDVQEGEQVALEDDSHQDHHEHVREQLQRCLGALACDAQVAHRKRVDVEVPQLAKDPFEDAGDPDQVRVDAFNEPFKRVDDLGHAFRVEIWYHRRETFDNEEGICYHRCNVCSYLTEEDHDPTNHIFRPSP